MREFNVRKPIGSLYEKDQREQKGVRHPFGVSDTLMGEHPLSKKKG